MSKLCLWLGGGGRESPESLDVATELILNLLMVRYPLTQEPL